MHTSTTKKGGHRAVASWLAVGMAAVLAGCGNSGPEELAKGEQLLREGNYPAAIELLTKATQNLPDDWRGYNYLGMAYQRQGDYENSKEQYTKALALVDKNPELVNEVNVVRYNLGRLYLDHGRPAQAAEELATYTLQVGDSFSGFFWRGTAEYQAGTADSQPEMLERAETSLRRAIELDAESTAAFNRLGMVQMALSKPVDARASFLRAHALDKQFAPAILNLAVIHEQHPGEDAHQSLNQAFLYYLAYLDLAEEGSDNWTAAQAAMNRLNLKLNPPTVAQVEPAPAQPEPEANAGPRANPLPAEPLPPLTPDEFTVRVPLDGSGRGTIVPTVPTRPTRPLRNTNVEPLPTPVPPEPVKPVEPTPKPTPSQPVTPPNPPKPVEPKPPVQPQPVEVAKKPEPTQPVVPKPPPAAAKPTTPELPDLPNVARYTYTNPARPVDGDRKKANEHFKKARHAHGINRLQQAVAGYKQAIAADPGYQQAHLNLALASHQDGDHAQALKSYEVALKLNPLSIDARYNFALALQQRGFYLDALAESERLLKDLPNLLNGHLLVANLYSENLKLPRRAKPHYEKVLEMNPRHTQAPSIRQWLSAHP